MPAEIDKPLGRDRPNAPVLRILEVHSFSRPNQGFLNESNESSFTVTKCLKKARMSISDQEYDKICEKVITPLSSVLKSTPPVRNTPPYVKSVQSDFLAMWKFMNSISERDLTHLDAVYGANLKKNEAAVVNGLQDTETILRDKGEPEKKLSFPVKLADGSSYAEIPVQSEPLLSSASVTSSQEVTEPGPKKPERRKPERRDSERRNTIHRKSELRELDHRKSQQRNTEQTEPERRNSKQRKPEQRNTIHRKPKPEQRELDHRKCQERNTEQTEPERRNSKQRKPEQRNTKHGKPEPRKPDQRKPESRELEPKKPFRILQNKTAPQEAPDSSNEKQNPGSLPPSRDDLILRNDVPTEEYSPLKNEYSLGSVVLAHIDGFPWWPAIVDDDPDSNYYCWLGNGVTEKPTHYHVVFFSKPVSRSWFTRSRLQPYNEKTMATLKVKEAALDDRRLRYAIKRAEISGCIEQEKRLHFYGFFAKYKGKAGDLRSKGALKRYMKNGHKRS